jgi:hypothetical protein
MYNAMSIRNQMKGDIMSKRQQINALVRTETEVAIKINPSIPYSTLMKEFSECIFKVETYEELFQFIAAQIACGNNRFIEGVGKIEYNYGQEFTEDVVVLYSLNISQSETDIVGTEYV